MKIINFSKDYTDKFLALFNKEAKKNLYRTLNSDTVNNEILLNPYYQNELFLVAIENKKVVASALGFIKDETGFITFIIGKPNLKGMLLKNLEKTFKTKNVKKIRNFFGSPFNLGWTVKEMFHPGMPAVLKGSELETTLLFHNYKEEGVIYAYFLSLKNFCFDNQTLQKNLADKSIYTAFYDQKTHKDLLLFFDKINNESWKKTVINNLNTKNLPMIVLVKDNKVIGWSGPISIDGDGRGVFGGIGVDPKFQGHGCGTLLFSELCWHFKNSGARFMSLFTGSDNKARFIYEKMGFIKEKEFSILSKNLGETDEPN